MSANTTIEWATKSWNPVRGCSRVSPGCDECYAMKFAHRFSGAGKPYEGLTTIRRGKVDWSGVARFIPGELDAPLNWRKAERVFVNSMSDLFHHSLTNEQIAACFGVMAARVDHQFLVLTKRPDRMRDFFAWATMGVDTAMRCYSEVLGVGAWKRLPPVRATTAWPLPNVWLGASAENQELADERWDELSRVPADVRWLSMEPLLGPITMRHWAALPDWVVVGGESGPGARPMGLEWVRSLVTECRELGIKCFVKQFGARPFAGRTVDGIQGRAFFPKLQNKKGGDLTEIPGDWPREFPR